MNRSNLSRRLIMTTTRCPISRRSFLQAGAAAGALAATRKIASRAYAGEELTFLTWETYHDDEWLKEWSDKTGVKTNVTRIGSNDESYEKLRSGAIVADMTIVDTGSIPRFKKAGIIVPIDAAKFGNASNIAAGMNFPKVTTVEGDVMAVPYNWGTQPLMFNTEKVNPVPDNWYGLWDKKFEGRVSIPDDSYTVVPMAAIAMGAKDPFNLTDEEFDKLAQTFRDLRGQIKTLARGFDDQTAIFASGDADIGYCENISSVLTLQDQGKPVGYSFPPGTLAWIDCAALTPTGVKRQIVYDFVNEMLTPQWQARFIAKSGNNGILDLDTATKAGVPEDKLKRTNIPDMKDPEFWKKMVFFQNPEDVDRRLEIWNAFKAGTL
jgi:spermidine/putrescine transport system substrate-binding protein